MNSDNKVAYFGGFIFTTMMSMPYGDILKSAAIGLVGGFFGILGKELYYWLKRKINGTD